MCKGMAIVTRICVLLALCLSLVATQPVFNCSLISVAERVSCSVPSPNATTCQGTGCCWDPGNPNLMCFTKPGGRCIPYHKSGLCYDALNSTLPEYRDWPRFIDNRLGYPMTELFISGVQDAIRDSASDFPECQRILSAMLCQYTLVPCRDDHTLMSFCKEDCEAIFGSCQQPLNQAIGGAKQLAKFKNIEFVHIGFPNCSNYKYSNEYDKSSNNNTCIRTGFFSFQKPKPKGKDDGKDVSILAIVLPIVIVVFILIVVVIIFVMRRQMRKRENALANSNFLVNKDAMTMRQKLRADSLKNIDQRLMRLYDPEKLQHYPLDRVEYVKDLGEGHFGKVFQGT